MRFMAAPLELLCTTPERLRAGLIVVTRSTLAWTRRSFSSSISGNSSTGEGVPPRIPSEQPRLPSAPHVVRVPTAPSVCVPQQQRQFGGGIRRTDAARSMSLQQSASSGATLVRSGGREFTSRGRHPLRHSVAQTTHLRRHGVREEQLPTLGIRMSGDAPTRS